MKLVKVSDIIIPESFRNSCPNQYKINRIKRYVSKHKKLDKPVVLDGDSLVDNYIRYLVAAELNMDRIPCISIQEYQEMIPDGIICIKGKFPECDKEYVWRLSKDIPLSIGSKAIVESRKTHDVVTVTNIFKTNNPRHLKHKFVVGIVVDDGKEK